MKKRIIAFLLTLISSVGLLVGCNDDSTSSSSDFQEIDYAASVTLDMNSNTKKQEAEVKMFIDGDTTHFHVPTSIAENGVLKARYLAINTPESTGKIEVWGKKASNFTKSKLQSASSIILETDGTDWELDSTGDRHLVWVWYKPEGENSYRNLNIEILQNGLAIASNSEGNRYGETCGKAIKQATDLKLHVHSNEKDPDFYYGDAQPIDLKELRLNIEQYDGQKVAFEGVVSYLYNDGAFVESYDDETNIYYGIYIYCGKGAVNPFLMDDLIRGNKFRFVGSVTEFNGSYQVSGIEYDMRNPDSPNSSKLLETECSIADLETTVEKFNSNVTLEILSDDEETVEEKSFPYAQLAMQSSIAMNGLRVVSTYTTDNGGNSDGAITIRCEDNEGNEITVRTIVLKDSNGQIVTADTYKNKTIDVKGVIDYFKPDGAEKGDYQVKVFNLENITIH